MNRQSRELSLLFSRLTWPSGMVRERACVALAELLVDDKWTVIVQEHLLQWMETQPLETVVALGLLVPLRATIRDESFKDLSTDRIRSAVKRPSVLSHMLLRELGIADCGSPDWVALNSGDAPSDFDMDDFFTTYWKSFVPPIYALTAQQIERRKLIPFVRQWAFEWDVLLRRINMGPSREPLNFWGREHSDHYCCIDFQLSEVYRSAYLRVLAWCVAIGQLSERDAVFHAATTCPIDLALWGLNPSEKPNWWPHTRASEGTIDTLPAQIWQQTSAVWDRFTSERETWSIAHATGRVHQGRIIYELEILGLFQKCFGPSPPRLEELAAWYVQRENILYACDSLLRFEGTIEMSSPEDFAEDFGGWSVLPASSPIWPHSTPRWQSWRIHRRIWLPSPFLSESDMGFRCGDKAVVARDTSGVVGKWTDWTHNLSEKMTANLPPSNGSVLFVPVQRIRAFTERTGSVFCWVCRLTGYYREHDYGEMYKQFQDHRQFGASSIVTP